jgi:hypothetical protein
MSREGTRQPGNTGASEREFARRTLWRLDDHDQAFVVKGRDTIE